jgi:hypothetical protein
MEKSFDYNKSSLSRPKGKTFNCEKFSSSPLPKAPLAINIQPHLALGVSEEIQTQETRGVL